MFVGEDGCLKIGDFGLSRPEAASHTDNPPAQDLSKPGGPATAIIPRSGNLNNREGHTTGVGTASYASPEQLQGRRYGLRSDLFSLGLVLLELCCCFNTTHERAAAFQSMRSPNGSAPAHLFKRSPAIAGLAEQLCRTVPEQRPSALEALQRVEELCERCTCRVCAKAAGGSPDGEGHESDCSEDARLRKELAVKTRIVEEQVGGVLLHPNVSLRSMAVSIRACTTRRWVGRPRLIRGKENTCNTWLHPDSTHSLCVSCPVT